MLPGNGRCQVYVLLRGRCSPSIDVDNRHIARGLPNEGQVVLTADSESQRRLASYEREVAELQEQAKILEEEVITLRRRLQDAPKRVRTLEEKLLDTQGQLAQTVSQSAEPT